MTIDLDSQSQIHWTVGYLQSPYRANRWLVQYNIGPIWQWSEILMGYVFNITLFTAFMKSVMSTLDGNRIRGLSINLYFYAQVADIGYGFLDGPVVSLH